MELRQTLCNLDCSYCPAEIHDNFSPHTNEKVIHDTIDALYELDKPVRVSFTGGEPTVHPKINEIIEHARATTSLGQHYN